MLASHTQRLDNIEQGLGGVKEQLDGLASSIGQLVTEVASTSLEQLRNTIAEENHIAFEVESQEKGDKVTSAFTLLDGRLNRFREDQDFQLALLKTQQDKPWK